MVLTRVVYGLGRRLWGKSAPSVGRGNVTLGAARDSIWAGEILSLPDFDLPAVERAHLTHPGATWVFVDMDKSCLFPNHAVPALFQRLSSRLGTFHAAPCIPLMYLPITFSLAERCWRAWEALAGWVCIPRLPWSSGFTDLQDTAGTDPALNALFVLGCSSCELSSSGLS